ncbi:MAG: N-acetyltransferase family protein [Spirochaetota bacterium]
MVPLRTPVTIRRATVADAPEVFRLVRELAVYERLDHQLRAAEEDVARAMASDTPRLHVLLAFETPEEAALPGAAAVGFALSFFTLSTFEGRPTHYLEDLFVEPEHRGAGIGGALLSRLGGQAGERPPERVPPGGSTARPSGSEG